MGWDDGRKDYAVRLSEVKSRPLALLRVGEGFDQFCARIGPGRQELDQALEQGTLVDLGIRPVGAAGSTSLGIRHYGCVGSG